MEAYEIAKPYASALVALGEEKNILSQLEEEIEVCSELFQKEPKFRIFLESPHIFTSEKKALLQKVLQKDFSQIFLNFLCLLIDKRRFLIFSDIGSEFKSLLDQKEGRLRAQIFSAQELEPDMVEEITQALERKTGKKVLVDHKIKPGLIGGLVLKIGETQIDGSLQNRLEDWKSTMIQNPL